MQLKTILNRIEKHSSFVYGDPMFEGDELLVPIQPRANGRAVCSGCNKRCGTYDTAREPRRFQFVPLWGIVVFFLYAMRRVNCPDCGVKIESIPWSDGKRPVTTSFAWFLARWAKRMSWKEVSDAFQTSWECVFRSVETAVEWGRQHMDLSGIKSIGVDEILWRRGHRYLTVVYQIDNACKRLLWAGEDRKLKTLLRFFKWFGRERAGLLEFVCSDMWKPYLRVLAKKANSAIHVLDRFHIMSMLNKAIDEVRAKEARRMKAEGYEPILKKSRWCLLKRPENLTEKQEAKLSDLVRYNLASVRAYLLKEDFQAFWQYVSPAWAGKFIDHWTTRVMRSRIEPMKKIAKTLRRHRELILNWFHAKGMISSGTVEGLNTNAKLTMRKARGYRTPEAAKIGLYHALGALPEPNHTHRFC
jgi:transposase